MAASKTGSTIRADINTFVEQGKDSDKLFIAEQVFPPAPVDVKSGEYPVIPLAEGQKLNDVESRRKPRSAAQEIIREWTTDTYDCEEHALRELADDQQSDDNSRFFDQEVVAGKFCGSNLRLKHEIRVAAAVQNTNNFTATAASVNYTESNIATIDVQRDVMDAVERLHNKGVMPNTIVMSSTLFNQIRRSTLFQNYVRGNITSTTASIISASDAKGAFAEDGISNFLVGRSPKNTNKKGQAYAGSKIWNNNYIWVGQVESGDPYSGGAGRTFYWSQRGSLWNTKSYRHADDIGNYVEVWHNTAEKVIDSTAGELITTSYSAS